MLTEIEDGDDPKNDRKRWIGTGTGHPCVALDRDGNHNESSAIEELMWSMVTSEEAWFLVSFLGDVEAMSLCRRMVQSSDLQEKESAHMTFPLAVLRNLEAG